jgi:hypothetical protein
LGQVIYSYGYSIPLTTGWNLVSSPVTPTDPDMEAVFDELIVAGKLVKVQAETGNSMEKDINNVWQNNIGNWQDTEGYYVKVTEDCFLNIYGGAVPLPLNVGLLTGWNIISYPELTAKSAMTILQPLINAGVLLKVQDEAGSAIEMDIFGNWINNIGNFEAGEGYYVKVSGASSISYTGLERTSGQGADKASQRKNTRSSDLSKFSAPDKSTIRSYDQTQLHKNNHNKRLNVLNPVLSSGTGIDREIRNNREKKVDKIIRTIQQSSVIE